MRDSEIKKLRSLLAAPLEFCSPVTLVFVAFCLILLQNSFASNGWACAEDGGDLANLMIFRDSLLEIERMKKLPLTTMSKFTRGSREFLTTNRRNALKWLAALPLTVVAPWPAAASRTPSATEGPFYPTPAMRFADADNDLVKIAEIIERAGGEVIVLKGHARNRAGQPVAGARVEIWQCDANGRYLHTSDRSGSMPRDPAFQGFGHVVTGPDGAYAFRTIKPVAYPGRTPHIHVKVIHGRRELTTQFYIADHPQNAGDWLFRRMSAQDQRAVSMFFIGGANGLETTVDIIL